MKTWHKGRWRWAVWRAATGSIAEVLPVLHVTCSWPAPWCRVSSLTVSLAWLRWHYAVSVEVRHG